MLIGMLTGLNQKCCLKMKRQMTKTRNMPAACSLTSERILMIRQAGMYNFECESKQIMEVLFSYSSLFSLTTTQPKNQQRELQLFVLLSLGDLSSGPSDHWNRFRSRHSDTFRLFVFKLPLGQEQN